MHWPDPPLPCDTAPMALWHDRFEGVTFLPKKYICRFPDPSLALLGSPSSTVIVPPRGASETVHSARCGPSRGGGRDTVGTACTLGNHHSSPQTAPGGRRSSCRLGGGAIHFGGGRPKQLPGADFPICVTNDTLQQQAGMDVCMHTKIHLELNHLLHTQILIDEREPPKK